VFSIVLDGIFKNLFLKTIIYIPIFVTGYNKYTVQMQLDFLFMVSAGQFASRRE
jgi:hypothetical protein